MDQNLSTTPEELDSLPKDVKEALEDKMSQPSVEFVKLKTAGSMTDMAMRLMGELDKVDESIKESDKWPEGKSKLHNSFLGAFLYNLDEINKGRKPYYSAEQLAYLEQKGWVAFQEVDKNMQKDFAEFLLGKRSGGLAGVKLLANWQKIGDEERKRLADEFNRSQEKVVPPGTPEEPTKPVIVTEKSEEEPAGPGVVTKIEETGTEVKVEVKIGEDVLIPVDLLGKPVGTDYPWSMEKAQKYSKDALSNIRGLLGETLYHVSPEKVDDFMTKYGALYEVTTPGEIKPEEWARLYQAMLDYRELAVEGLGGQTFLDSKRKENFEYDRVYNLVGMIGLIRNIQDIYQQAANYFQSRTGQEIVVEQPKDKKDDNFVPEDSVNKLVGDGMTWSEEIAKEHIDKSIKDIREIMVDVYGVEEGKTEMFIKKYTDLYSVVSQGEIDEKELEQVYQAMIDFRGLVSEAIGPEEMKAQKTSFENIRLAKLVESIGFIRNIPDINKRLDEYIKQKEGVVKEEVKGEGGWWNKILGVFGWGKQPSGPVNLPVNVPVPGNIDEILKDTNYIRENFSKVFLDGDLTLFDKLRALKMLEMGEDRVQELGGLVKPWLDKLPAGVVSMDSEMIDKMLQSDEPKKVAREWGEKGLEFVNQFGSQGLADVVDQLLNAGKSPEEISSFVKNPEYGWLLTTFGKDGLDDDGLAQVKKMVEDYQALMAGQENLADKSEALLALVGLTHNELDLIK
ncbi:hypothetical protein KJ855_00605 [Patescibacteria group bacterium]|nr:hypothetical protein [Patescibacteria group bacterium]